MPMELLTIKRGQKKAGLLIGDQQAKLVKIAAQRPEDKRRDIGTWIQKSSKGMGKSAQDFGLAVEQKPSAVNARLLPAPVIEYQQPGHYYAGTTGAWNMKDVRFFLTLAAWRTRGAAGEGGAGLWGKVWQSRCHRWYNSESFYLLFRALRRKFTGNALAWCWGRGSPPSPPPHLAPLPPPSPPVLPPSPPPPIPTPLPACVDYLRSVLLYISLIFFCSACARVLAAGLS